MVTTRYKPGLDRLLQLPAERLGRLGLSPTAITLAGLIISGLICLWFIFARAVLPFCLAITVVGCLDALDGAVARATGRVTKLGSYLDAVCDRYVEAMVACSVAYVTGYWLLTTAVLVGSLLVSYTKARAAMEVTISNKEWPDLMERPERDLLFIVGLAASAAIPWKPLGHDIFWWTLILLVILVQFTVIQRIRRACRFIVSRDSR